MEQPTLAIIFNEKSGPEQVADLIDREHAFVQYEMVETADERGSAAWVLLVSCETATPDQLYSLIGNRLPDYIRARRFPPSRIPGLRRASSAAPR